MVIPIGTDQYAKRTPVTTIWLIVANVIVYAVIMVARRSPDPQALEGLLEAGALSRAGFHLWQPITYQFLHDPTSIMHLLGNMIFLWTFGTSVEGRFGRLGFLVFYLCGGAIAGLAQIALASGATIGASGSVSAVTGAFIALFPRARVAVLFFFSVVPMPAMLLVAIYFALDFLGVTGSGGGGVAHLAHIAGTLFGLGVTLSLIGTGLIKRTDLDLLYLIRQWRRRAEMRRSLRGATKIGPWESATKDVQERLRSSGVAAPPAKPEAANGSVAPSPRGTNDGGAINPQSAQTRIATRNAARLLADGNGAYHAGNFAAALQHYDAAITHAPQASEADQARLMIAVICTRKMVDLPRARAALTAIGSTLPQELRPLAATLLEEAAQ